MFDEANGYIKAKAAEFDLKRIKFSDALFTKTKLEQRQMAAKYAAGAGNRKGLSSEDHYYLGFLHWIAENLDGTVENLTQFFSDTEAPEDKAQTARSIVVVVLAKQAKLAEAEELLAKYLAKDTTKLTEITRMEAEVAKAYQSQKLFAKMAPHAVASYEASKALLNDQTSRARGLDEILDSGMLVFESYRDGENPQKAEAALDDMRETAASTGSTSFYYYAVDRKIKYLIDTGRKAEAMEYYSLSIARAARDFSDKTAESEIKSRLKKREKHYNLLGLPAPELTNYDQWFPGKPRTFAEMKGKVILLDFWAIWCGPCFEAFPSLIEWDQDFKKQGLEIIGLTRYYGEVNGFSADEPHEAEFLKGFRLRERLPYDFVVSKGQGIQNMYGATLLPTAVLIDRKGIVRYVEAGTSPTRLGELREMILKLLAEK